jgi:RNA recognition motif-containing protein
MFAEHGKVLSAVVMRDEEGHSRGFGFVNMESPDQAAAAVEAINGTEINGKPVYVGRAQKKAEREAMLKAKCVGAGRGAGMGGKKRDWKGGGGGEGRRLLEGRWRWLLRVGPHLLLSSLPSFKLASPPPFPLFGGGQGWLGLPPSSPTLNPLS